MLYQNNLDSVYEYIANVSKDTHDDNLKHRITNALIGKYLIVEFKKNPNVSSCLAKSKARNKAEIIAEIIVSAMNAQQLAKELSEFTPEFKEFYQQYVGENLRIK